MALTYPIRVPVEGKNEHGVEGSTGSVDYLKLQRFAIDYEKSPAGYGGQNLPGSKAATKIKGQPVYMAMPAALSAAYAAQYQTIDVGQGGVMALQMAGTAMGEGDAKTKAESMTGSIQAAASSMFPEIAFNKGASLGASIMNNVGLNTQLDGKSAMALTKGKIVNPFTEQVFNGVPFRNHSFSWKMFARNYKEAQRILAIIQTIKMGVLPQFGNAPPPTVAEGENKNWTYKDGMLTVTKPVEGDGNEQTSAPAQTTTVNLQGRYLKTPDRFNLEFVRLDQNGTGLRKIPHYRFHPCICNSFNVNYTPDGQYVSFKDAIAKFSNNNNQPLPQMMVPAVQIDISFAETKILTTADAAAGF